MTTPRQHSQQRAQHRAGLDAVRDVVALALLLAAADPAAEVWGSPQRWLDLLRLSRPGAAAAILLFVASAASARRAQGARLTHRACLGLLAVPLVANLLLLLTAPALLGQIGDGLVGRFAASQTLSIGVGRAAVLVLVNELLVVGIAWVGGRPWARRVALHALLVASAVFVVCAPAIADAGTAAYLVSAPGAVAIAAMIGTTMIAATGLWGQTFLVTGAIMAALRGAPASFASARKSWREGASKGAIYSGCLMLLLYALQALLDVGAGMQEWRLPPFVFGATIGALSFPLLKTIVETFDGNAPLFGRLLAAATRRENYLRGAVLGTCLAAVVGSEFGGRSTICRVALGAAVGALAYGGVDVALDLWAIGRKIRRKLQAPRVYAFGATLGAVVGAALAWYFDAAQVAAVTTKLRAYATLHYDADSGIERAAYVIYPLFSKWGAIDLGVVGGGSRLLFSESLSGVINWSLAAPLFSLNLVVLTAAVKGSMRPLQGLLTRDGIIDVVEQTFRVQRWGLWMAPIIYSLLRMAPDPTWYNQDGAIRTAVAIGQAVALDPASFREWSLEVFLGLLAYDWFRVLIWFDHMGLRVATLVNASFVVGDVVDERSARFLGHATHSRAIPEGIRRFATWGPLLIPFYIPRGAEWDSVWNHADGIASSGAPLTSPVATVTAAYAASMVIALVLIAVVGAIRRSTRQSPTARRATTAAEAFVLRNDRYATEIRTDGCGFSRAESVVAGVGEIDLNPRPRDMGPPQGKFTYVRELRHDGEPHDVTWSTTLEPARHADGAAEMVATSPTSLEIVRAVDGLRLETTIRLAEDEATELRSLRIVNLEARHRVFEVTSYQEIALAGVEAFERHPAYHALHVGTRFVRPLGAILAHNRRLGTTGSGANERQDVFFHAVAHDDENVVLNGYEDSRALFLGAGTARAPEAIERSDFRAIEDEGLAYSFDPVASLRVRVAVGPLATATVRYVDGCAPSEKDAARVIAERLRISTLDDSALTHALAERRSTIARRRIRSDEAPFEFRCGGSELVTTPDTSRPWHHLIANPLGHGAVLGNDGAIFSFAGNSQQNGITPFFPETIPAAHVGQAVYVVDLETGRIDSPTFVPVRRDDACHSSTFGLGYGVYSARTSDIAIEMTVFCPSDAPAEVRVLRITNRTANARRYRVVAYLELALGELARDGWDDLEVDADVCANAVWFRRPEHAFRRGTAFVAWSLATSAFVTDPERFFGDDPRNLANPAFVRTGEPAWARHALRGNVAAMAGVVDVGVGKSVEVVLVIGQTSSRSEGMQLIARLADPAAASASLEETRAWWREKLSVLRIETDRPDFDRLVNDWLPYQALTARLWGRTGPSQRSGGYGYRDQLQDVVPFAMLDPALARRQIVLHSSRQFLEGDVLQWWHTAHDGRVGLGARNHSSDPHLWLIHVVGKYVAATGDTTVLHERTAFLEGPALRLREHGSVFVPRVSRDSATVYEHCLLAVERTLERRGPHGLPLIGRGDWNDSLDALGPKGRGESVWLGFFLHDSLTTLARLAELGGFPADARRYAEEAERLAAVLAKTWRDDHFVRAYADDGRAIEFPSALMAAWPALTSAVDFDRALAAVQSGLASLELDDMVLLLTPPFTRESSTSPGKISLYPPGVRENGGQYSHGCSWLVDALVGLSVRAAARGDTPLAQQLSGRAFGVWEKISPLRHVVPERIDLYGLPPHQQAADIYSGEGYRGRGGWSWYTGAASRMLTAAHALLGIEAIDGDIKLRSLPPDPSGGFPRLKNAWWRGERLGRD